MLKKCISLVAMVVLALVSQAQSLPVPANIQKAYERGTRSASGKPGQSYWQNTADYQIKLNFNPQTREVAGIVNIVYLNNSPDSLRSILFKLYPNLYQKGAPRASRIAAADIGDGVKIERLEINNVDETATMIADHTNYTVRVKPVPPGQKTKVSVKYSYILNKGSHNRTGEVDEGSAFVAYFFPRIAVYDDTDGWNRYPYRGSEEFYNDFCNFDAEITVPDKFVVWATGDLTNPSDVLQDQVVGKLVAAGLNDAIVNVIDSADLNNNAVTKAGAHTWKFSARNVPDFVFATSDHYLWKSTSLTVDPKTSRRTRVDVAFNPKHRDFYEVIDFSRKTVQLMSYTFPKWPFPYSHETVFDGLDQMEYPMMVNDNPLDNREDAITLTDHEIFHTMFPFYMGTNETKYGWMDEGWATIGEWLLSPMIDSTIVDEYGIAPYSHAAGSEADLPVATLTTQQSGTGSFINVYAKPAMGYLYVKDLLGDELFTKALHTYINEWNGKHPIPWDFFNCMNRGAGQDLNWFWQRWFFDDGVPDLAVSAVKPQPKGYQITVASVGTKPVPVDVIITYSDKTTETIHRTIAVWKTGKRSVDIHVDTAKKIQRVLIKSTHVSDVNRKNNLFIVK